MKRTQITIVLILILIFTTVGWATPPNNRPPDNRPPNKNFCDPKPIEPVTNTFAPVTKVSPVITNTNTFTPVNNVTGGPSYGDGSGNTTTTTNTNTFAGITGGSLSTPGIARTASATGPSPQTTGVGISGIGQQNNSGSGQTNNGIGSQVNVDGAGVFNSFSGQGAGSTNVNNKYEEARQMAAIAVAVSRELHFKDGAHSEITDSRVIDVTSIIGMLDTVSYEDCKRGKGSQGAVKIVDGLIRPQEVKTTSITFHEKGSTLSKKDYRFMGFVTGVAGTNDTSMPNVVYGVGEFAMEAGATDLVHLKESATEWGDTTGYSFDLAAFVTSIIGGAGNRAIGPAGSAGAGVSGMKGGSADRGDAAFAVFVSNEHLTKVSETFQKKE